MFNFVKYLVIIILDSMLKYLFLIDLDILYKNIVFICYCIVFNFEI